MGFPRSVMFLDKQGTACLLNGHGRDFIANVIAESHILQSEDINVT